MKKKTATLVRRRAKRNNGGKRKDTGEGRATQKRKEGKITALKIKASKSQPTSHTNHQKKKKDV